MEPETREKLKRFAKLSKIVSEVLWTQWDPIGVNDEPIARSEYDLYVPAVSNLLWTGSPANVIAEKLLEFESENMAFGSPCQTMANLVARMLVEDERVIALVSSSDLDE